jgi:transcriptional regulator with XRE-family HTH domain
VWAVKAKALREHRKSKLLTVEALAELSGVGARTIHKYESGKGGARLAHLEFLAKALEVPLRAIARADEDETKDTRAERAEPAAAPAPPKTARLPRTSLETLVDAERAANAKAPPLTTKNGKVPALTAKKLQDVYTAYALHAGTRMYVRGVIDSQRGVDAEEAKHLGGKPGECARFHVLAPLAGGSTLGVTVHARAKHAIALQERAGDGTEATLVVRVHVVAGGADAVFTAFIMTAKKPWALLVEEIRG